MENLYGPEDIEQLMLAKSFDELLEEEKLYVLKHIDSPIEYQNMRSTLLGFIETEDDLTVPITLRDELIKVHENQHRKSSFKIWLNSLFANLKGPQMISRPALQLAGIAVLLLGSVFIFNSLETELNANKVVVEPDSTTEEAFQRTEASNTDDSLEKNEAPLVEQAEEIQSDSKKIDNELTTGSIIETEESLIEELAMDLEEEKEVETPDDNLDQSPSITAPNETIDDDFGDVAAYSNFDLDETEERVALEAKPPMTIPMQVDKVNQEVSETINYAEEISSVSTEVIALLYTAW